MKSNRFNLQLIALALLLVLGGFLSGCSRAMDATDDLRGGRTSRMTLLTDYGTGCEYLAFGGGLVPRVDNSGKHLCRPVSK